MPKAPDFLPQGEYHALVTPGQLQKRSKSFRLSKEARRIIKVEAKRYGCSETRALEIILREIRELRKT